MGKFRNTMFSFSAGELISIIEFLVQCFSTQITPRPVFTTSGSRQKSSHYYSYLMNYELMNYFTFLLPLKSAFGALMDIILLTLMFCLDKTTLYSLLGTIKNIRNISATCLKSFMTRRLRNAVLVGMYSCLL